MEKIIFHRNLMDKIKTWLFQGKVIILYGPRQVGKTTIMSTLIAGYQNALYLNCERPVIGDLLTSKNPERIRQYIGQSTLVVFDEAQRIPEIGELLKLLHDTYPDIQFIATGSSSFELFSKLSEPLTGRNVKFLLYPISMSELLNHFDVFQREELLESLLIFGSYPDIINRPDSQKYQLLDELTSDYLFRDVLRFENVKKSNLLVNLLKAIALQIGHEVSYRELSNLLKVAVETVQRYLLLLEQSFVIYSLSSFSRNLRNEISRGRKYFFYDTGIRNALLQNFTPLANRNDAGQLWENFCINERIRYNQALDRRVNIYFWRTFQQQEIDLIEEIDGKLHAFEFKWNPAKSKKPPAGFLEAYSNSTFQVINKENYMNFLTL